jgi:hypothetical protein
MRGRVYVWLVEKLTDRQVDEIWPTAKCSMIYQGCRVCDGHDPEGNVVQFRQR